MGKAGKDKLSLIALDIEGDWNVPLLQNAADISGALLRFAKSDNDQKVSDEIEFVEPVQEVLSQYRTSHSNQ